MAGEYWDDLAHHTEQDEIWMSHPLVRERINLRVSGRPHVWPTEWLGEQVASGCSLRRVASIGCGIGNLERDLAARGLVENCVGIDTAGQCIDEAKRLARDAGLADRLIYQCADAWTYLARASNLDAVLFHGSLHHFTHHDNLLRLAAAALAPGGLVYIDEYVGPSRDEWHPWSLIIPNLVYRFLPHGVRRTRIIRYPINHEDPTEAVESSQILPALERAFGRVTRRDYGGNLLSMIYPNLHRPRRGAPGREHLDRAVSLMLDLEEVILRHRRKLATETFFTVAIAQL